MRNMKFSMILGGVLLFSNLAIAEDSGSGFALRAESGYTYFENHIRVPGSSYSLSTNVLKYYDLTVGGTLFLPHGFTLDAYYRTPISKPSSLLTSNGVISPVDVGRNEYNLTISYALSPNFNVFTGWRAFSVKTSSVGSRFVIGAPIDSKFSSNGPTAGLSYVVHADNSNFNHVFSAGLSYQQGKFEFPFAPITKASGLAYSASYKLGYFLDDSWDMSLGVDTYYLRVNNIKAGSFNYSYIDGTISARFGLRYIF